MQSPAQSRFFLKLLPSFADFAFLLPVAFLFGRMGGIHSLLGDGDTGWHIRTGQWILAHRAVPSADPFSFTKPGEPWFAWEWLSDVVLALLHRAGGLQAVAVFGIVMLCLVFSLLFRLVRRRANPIVAIAITIVAAAASSIHWLARPHLFTLLFLVIFYHALESIREGRTRVAGLPWLAVFPVITVLWTNLHGGFFVGILMICAYGTGELITLLLAPSAEGRRPRWERARAYFLSAAACLAASLVNPYFYELHVHTAKYLQNPFNSQHIMEFLSPSFHHPTAIFFEAMLVLGAATAVWNFSARRFTEPVLLGLWAHAALLATRNIPIFMIVAAPAVAAALDQWLRLVPRLELAGWVRKAAARFNRLADETGVSEAVGRFHLVSAAGFAIVLALIYSPQPPRKFRAEFDPQRYPEAALATLRQLPGARIFSNDEWGDYLIYSLYPRQRVFVDGRSDFYGNDFEEEYLDAMNVKHGWEETFGRFRIDTILLPPDAPLTGALKLSGDWRVVFDDGTSLVFRSAKGAEGETASLTGNGGGIGRDRKIAKTENNDLAITK
jgi:hypothetical protein